MFFFFQIFDVKGRSLFVLERKMPHRILPGRGQMQAHPTGALEAQAGLLPWQAVNSRILLKDRIDTENVSSWSGTEFPQKASEIA